uniref:Uncharacterized protein n=1 Tax=Zea mays TaxID=4577 RepID=B4FML4_MAIZE|nr:unknown [Zea mays]
MLLPLTFSMQAYGTSILSLFCCCFNFGPGYSLTCMPLCVCERSCLPHSLFEPWSFLVRSLAALL